jgi:hypothetical protein
MLRGGGRGIGVDVLIGGNLVREIAQACDYSSQLDFRPSMDCALFADGDKRLAGVAERRLAGRQVCSGIVFSPIGT